MKRCNKPRNKTLGGSEAASVLDLNPYESAFDVWYTKTHEGKREFTENKYTLWGKLKEDIIAKHYSNITGQKLIKSVRRTAIYEWFSGTPDRLLLAIDDNDYIGTYDDPLSGKKLKRRGLEIKTALAKHKNKWSKGGGSNYATMEDVPSYYWVQCQWYMALMGFEEWDICVLLDSSDYRQFRLHRDDNWLKEAIERCNIFWEKHIATNKPPAVDWGRYVNHYYDSVFPAHSEEIRPATQDEEDIIKRLRNSTNELTKLVADIEDYTDSMAILNVKLEDVEALCKEKKKEVDLLNNLMRVRIGNVAGIKCKETGNTVTWKKPKSGSGRNRTLRKSWK